MDTAGLIQGHHNIDHMSLIHDMALTTSGDRIVGVGETLAREDLHAATESAIFRESLTFASNSHLSIHVVYNMKTEELEA